MLELKIQNISKHYKEKTAADDITFTLKNGVYGLLGENGAGKTTLLRILCGILMPDRGDVTLDGISIRKMGAGYRTLLGYLPQDFGYYPDFTVKRYLLYLASLKALPRDKALVKYKEMLELTGLLGEEKHAIIAGVCEMAARSFVGFCLVPFFGYAAVCFANPIAWVAADLFLIPAYRYVMGRLRRLMGRNNPGMAAETAV